MRIRNKYRYMQEGGEGGEGEAPPAATSAAVPPVGPFDGLDADYAQHLEKNGIKDVQGLIKQHMDAQSYMGNSIRVPGEDAGEDDRKAFYEKLRKHAPDLIPAPNDPDSKKKVFEALGMPEKSSDYSVEVPEVLAPQFNDDRLSMFREAAHKHNLTKEQFEGVMKEVLSVDASQYETMTAEHEKGIQSLKNEWGNAFDQRTAAVNKLIEGTGAPEQLANMAKEGTLDASVVKWLYDLGSRMGADESLNMTIDTGSGGAITPSEANDKLQEILNNREHPYWISSHPDHKNAVDKVIKLGRSANPDSGRQVGAAVSFSS